MTMSEEGKKAYEVLQKQERQLASIFSGSMESYADEHISLLGDVQKRVADAVKAIAEGKSGEAFVPFAYNTHLCLTTVGLGVRNDLNSVNAWLFKRAMEEGH